MKKVLFALFIAFAATSTVNAQSKVAHVNSQKLLDTIPSRKKAIEEIKFIEQKGMEELTEMDNAVKKAYDEYTKLPAGSAASVVQYSMDRVNKAQQALETRQGELEQQMQMMSQQLNDRILKNVKDAVDVVAKRKGLNYVIDEQGALFSSGVDITNEVIAELLKIDAKNPAAAQSATTPAKPQ
jgi:outer membrane protein